MSTHQPPNNQTTTDARGFDHEAWPLPEVRSMMIDNFARSWTQHWMAVITLFVTAMFCILFATWLVTPTWEGSAKLVLYPQGIPDITGTGATSTSSENLTPQMMVKNIVETVNSREFLAEVAKATDLAEYFRQRSETKPSLRTRVKKSISNIVKLKFLRGRTKPDYEAMAMEELESNWVSLAPMEGSSTVPLLIYGDTPEKTIEVGNAVLDEIQADMNRQFKSKIEQELARLIPLREAVYTQVSLLDEQIKAERDRMGILSGQAYADALVGGIADLRIKSDSLGIEVAGLRAKIEEYFSELENEPEFKEYIRSGTKRRDITNDSTYQRLDSELARLRGELESLLVTHEPTSRPVREQQAQIQSMEANIESLRIELSESESVDTSETTTPVLSPVRTEIMTRWIDAKARLKELSVQRVEQASAIAKLQEEQRRVIASDATLKNLQRQYEVELTQMSKIDGQIRQFELQRSDSNLFKGFVQRYNCTVRNEKKADFPSMLLAGVLALAISSFMALVLPIAYDYLNQTLLGTRQAASIPGVRVVAIVPRMSRRKMFTAAEA